MADSKNTTGVVKFTDSKGRTRWAGEHSKAHREHLKAQEEKDVKKSAAASAPAKPETKA